jgi:hypothetical protein
MLTVLSSAVALGICLAVFLEGESRSGRKRDRQADRCIAKQGTPREQVHCQTEPQRLPYAVNTESLASASLWQAAPQSVPRPSGRKEPEVASKLNWA